MYKSMNASGQNQDSVPEKVSVYETGELIGTGSVGAVYKCVSTQDNKTYAVKFMQVNPFFDNSVLNAIIDGSERLKNIQDKINIVKIYETGKTDLVYYIIMELCEKGTLENIIKNNTISTAQKIDISLSIANTLSYIHKMGIIHADLKPSNVLIRKDDTPCLNDFYHASNLTTNSTIFHTALPKGTPKYMSPEQATGQFLGPTTDIYSFGVLLYELTTGFVPYSEQPDNFSDMVNIIKKGDIIPPSERYKKISPKLEGVIMKLLKKNPSERYQSMQSVINDLKALKENKEISVPYKKSFWTNIVEIFSAR